MANNNAYNGNGTYHISANYNTYEVGRTNHFALIVDVGDVLRSDFPFDIESATEEDYYTGVQDILRLSVDSTFIPSYSTSVLSVKRGNSKVNYAGSPEWAGGSYKFTDYVNLRAYEILYAMQPYDAVNDAVKSQEDYKHTATLIEYTPDGKEVRRWEIIGLWINGVKLDDKSKQSDDISYVSCDIIYDRAILHQAQ